MNASTSRFYQPTNTFVSKAWEGDQLGREALGQRLTALVERMDKGGVLGVHAAWGEGKTWFCRHWLQSLGTKWPTAYIDAFEHDHLDDPFIMVSSALLALIKEQDPEAHDAVRQSVLDVGRDLVKAGGQALLAAGAAFLPGSAAAGELLVEAGQTVVDAGADALTRHLSELLERGQEGRARIEGLKAALSKFAEKRDKPLVIVIDELDRCRPDFALRTLERVKHFFDTPGVVFVMMVHREQLEATVRVCYGSLPGRGYLDKFVHLWLNLHDARDPRLNSADRHGRLLWHMLWRFDGERAALLQPMIGSFAELADAFEFSARDVERAASLLLAAKPSPHLETEYLMWAVMLKIALPEGYASLLAQDPRAHLLVTDGIAARFHAAKQPRRYLGAGLEIHEILKAPNAREPGSGVSVEYRASQILLAVRAIDL